ncbi:lipoate--protein ligase family protein [Paenibacillus mesophilus]|uniref:lipoate--protein ligase family protein n=1 Tax=Paenibacillus mesophilus TaxID=2582849 RepID=UPI00110F3E1C|nr:biotin/lipoate A/B protein ligase family protein [Paenibacillus mesophilus]TMV47847.1 lipoate--protein ligase family protein [Paenibacillus mesophilus]
MPETVWRFIKSGNGTPADNMAIDEAMLIAHSEGKTPPTVRFYGWEPATLSIGYFQRAEDEVDFEELRKQGIGFVRRPTGGRAVLHDRELTYSMIVSEDYPDMPTTVNEAYRVLSEGLLCGFRNLGLRAEMVNLGAEEEKAKYASTAGSAACFDSPSWYELVVEGRKIAGSAQTRSRGVILQHGSILLEMDVDQLFSLLRFSNERVKERLKQSFHTKAVAIGDICRAMGKPTVTYAQAEAAFHDGIGEGLGVRLVEGELTEYEKELAARLAAEKYGSGEWNFRR